MQQRAFEQIVERAAVRRAGIAGIATGGTNAYRLVDGAGDRLPGIIIDSYAGRWLVQTQDVPFPEHLRQPQLRRADCSAIWWKELTDTNRDAPRWISGADESEFTVLENGLSYAINFASGYSQGIFLDQRENRAWLRDRCVAGDSVLNLFAYTCAFSVAAATAGASTTSVDLSGNYLAWGRRNFEANGIDCTDCIDSGGGATHRIFKWDTFEFLKMAARKNERHQFIVCDPPTFSRNRAGKVFRAERDYPALVELCAPVLAPGGTLLCSTNHRGISRRKFEDFVRHGLNREGRALESLEFSSMPADFTGDAYLKACKARVV